MTGTRRVIVGTSGSPGSLRALRYAEDVARTQSAVLIPVLAWVPPGGDRGDRLQPSGYLRHEWQEAACQRLRDALIAAWGHIPRRSVGPACRAARRARPGPARDSVPPRRPAGRGCWPPWPTRPDGPLREGEPLLPGPCPVPGACRSATSPGSGGRALAAGMAVLESHPHPGHSVLRDHGRAPA